MSLKDPDDDYDDLVSDRKKLFKIPKVEKYAVVLVIGVIIGILLQLYAINPLLADFNGSTCKDCFFVKEMLNTENDCLYSLLDNPKEASERCAERNMPIITEQKDYNEETA
jgi:hypothetical protein